MFPIVPWIKSHLPWKFHENPFNHFSVMLLTDRQTDRQIDRQTDRITDRQTDKATDNDENITFAMAEVISQSALVPVMARRLRNDDAVDWRICVMWPEWVNLERGCPLWGSPDYNVSVANSSVFCNSVSYVIESYSYLKGSPVSQAICRDS